MNIALYFGSFNPIHKGHIAIAEYVASQSQFDQLWLIVSPLNPLKDARTIADQHSRFEMAEIGFSKSDYRHKILISDVEFSLPKPSYTIDTLRFLKNKYPAYNFSVIIGEDSLASFNKWKDWQEILDNYKMLVYPRENKDTEMVMEHENIVVMREVPLYPISSTVVRDAIKNGTDLGIIITEEVVQYIKKSRLYE